MSQHGGYGGKYMKNDEICRLCNFATVNNNNKSEYILTDIATRKRIKLDDPSLIEEVKSRLNNRYEEYRKNNVVPVTLLITGDFSQYDDETIHWHLSYDLSDFRYVFLFKKYYACSFLLVSEVNEEPANFKIVDKFTGANIVIKSTGLSRKLMLENTVNQIINSGSYEYFGPESDNYIIVIGNVQKILSHENIIEMDENTRLGDSEIFYKEWLEILDRHWKE